MPTNKEIQEQLKSKYKTKSEPVAAESLTPVALSPDVGKAAASGAATGEKLAGPQAPVYVPPKISEQVIIQPITPGNAPAPAPYKAGTTVSQMDAKSLTPVVVSPEVGKAAASGAATGEKLTKISPSAIMLADEFQKQTVKSSQDIFIDKMIKELNQADVTLQAIAATSDELKAKVANYNARVTRLNEQGSIVDQADADWNKKWKDSLSIDDNGNIEFTGKTGFDECFTELQSINKAKDKLREQAVLADKELSELTKTSESLTKKQDATIDSAYVKTNAGELISKVEWINLTPTMQQIVDKQGIKAIDINDLPADQQYEKMKEWGQVPETTVFIGTDEETNSPTFRDMYPSEVEALKVSQYVDKYGELPKAGTTFEGFDFGKGYVEDSDDLGFLQQSIARPLSLPDGNKVYTVNVNPDNVTTPAEEAWKIAALAVPGLYVAKNWNNLSLKDKAINIAIDAAILLPFVAKPAKAVISKLTNSAQATIKNGIKAVEGTQSALIKDLEKAGMSTVNLDKVSSLQNKYLTTLAKADEINDVIQSSEKIAKGTTKLTPKKIISGSTKPVSELKQGLNTTLETANTIKNDMAKAAGNYFDDIQEIAKTSPVGGDSPGLVTANTKKEFVESVLQHTDDMYNGIKKVKVTPKTIANWEKTIKNTVGEINDIKKSVNSLSVADKNLIQQVTAKSNSIKNIKASGIKSTDATQSISKLKTEIETLTNQMSSAGKKVNTKFESLPDLSYKVQQLTAKVGEGKIGKLYQDLMKVRTELEVYESGLDNAVKQGYAAKPDVVKKYLSLKKEEISLSKQLGKIHDDMKLSLSKADIDEIYRRYGADVEEGLGFGSPRTGSVLTETKPYVYKATKPLKLPGLVPNIPNAPKPSWFKNLLPATAATIRPTVQDYKKYGNMTVASIAILEPLELIKANAVQYAELVTPAIAPSKVITQEDINEADKAADDFNEAIIHLINDDMPDIYIKINNDAEDEIMDVIAPFVDPDVIDKPVTITEPSDIPGLLKDDLTKDKINSITEEIKKIMDEADNKAKNEIIGSIRPIVENRPALKTKEALRLKTQLKITVKQLLKQSIKTRQFRIRLPHIDDDKRKKVKVADKYPKGTVAIQMGRIKSGKVWHIWKAPFKDASDYEIYIGDKPPAGVKVVKSFTKAVETLQSIGNPKGDFAVDVGAFDIRVKARGKKKPAVKFIRDSKGKTTHALSASTAKVTKG